MKVLTENEKAFCFTLWKNGESITSIAKMLPYKITTAKNLVKGLIDNGYLPQRQRGEIVKERLIKLFESGITSPYELGEILGLKPSTIKEYKKLLRLKSKRPQKNYKPTILGDKTKQIIAEIENGVSRKELIEKFGVSRQYIAKVIKKYVKG